MADDSNRPAISQRIEEIRRKLKAEWDADHPGERGNPFTQEAVAARLPFGLGPYGQFERGIREPSLRRLREIALALGLDEDYFSPNVDLASATARLEAETDRLQQTNDALVGLLEPLRALLPPGQPARAPGERER